MKTPLISLSSNELESAVYTFTERYKFTEEKGKNKSGKERKSTLVKTNHVRESEIQLILVYENNISTLNDNTSYDS